MCNNFFQISAVEEIMSITIVEPDSPQRHAYCMLGT